MKLVARLENGIIDIVDIEEYKNNVESEYDRLKIENSVQDSVINTILNKKDKDRTPEELLKIVVRKRIDDGYKERIAKYDSYLPLKEEKFKGELKEGYFKRPEFREESGCIIESYKADVDVSFVKRKIREKQDELAATDYMIIKTYEAKVSGEEEPYKNIDEIIKQRKSLRDDINRLKEILNL